MPSSWTTHTRSTPAKGIRPACAPLPVPDKATSVSSGPPSSISTSDVSWSSSQNRIHRLRWSPKDFFRIGDVSTKTARFVCTLNGCSDVVHVGENCFFIPPFPRVGFNVPCPNTECGHQQHAQKECENVAKFSRSSVCRLRGMLSSNQHLPCRDIQRRHLEGEFNGLSVGVPNSFCGSVAWVGYPADIIG